MTKRFVLVLFGLLLASLGAKAQPAESAVREREEYSVYSAIVPEAYHDYEGGIMVIENPTGPGIMRSMGIYFIGQTR